MEESWHQPIGFYLRRNLREAAKLFLVAVLLRTRLVLRLLRSTPSSPEQSQTLFLFYPDVIGSIH
ncbi:hypothetical protein [Lapidilactobacillus wuchangensis]|uniref:hypothetical protein n=1 Tax=Lapidilactobacillus wuchangensis TaxID=2486001 RepID=UPI0013DE0B59|nr:hypothetical protein [Lapidilactobacillus wuchangensis]